LWVGMEKRARAERGLNALEKRTGCHAGLP
jgi:hypothetical protein